MERFIQLDLHSDSPQPAVMHLPDTEHQEPASTANGKRLNRLLNGFAHKASSEYARNKSGVFSK